MGDSKDSSKRPQSTVPSIDEIRLAHKAETERINRAIREGTVGQLRMGSSIFQHNLSPEEFQEKQRKRLESSTALRVFFDICEKWRLDESQISVLLGTPDRKTYDDFRCGSIPVLPNDVLVRISYVIGIYKALRRIFQTESQANLWPGKPNRDFENQSALQLMLEGELAKVRRYLEGQ